MRFGKLEINPTLSPGVLDTATWDVPAARAAVQAMDDASWQALAEAAARRDPLPACGSLVPSAPSAAWHRGTFYCLAQLPDGQQVLLAAGPREAAPLGEPIAAGERWAAFPTQDAILARFFRSVAPERGPRALGPVPRLGIGMRMTTAVWPAVWQALARGGYAANAIQNSVRELNLLEDLLAGRPPERNIAFGFGAIEAGYTGSTFEGLWVSGVLDALGSETAARAIPRYGADADHIQVKRGPEGLARARRLIDAARYYSFYTLDVSDVLDYDALAATPAAALARLEAAVPGSAERRSLVAFHRQKQRVAGLPAAADEADLGRLVGKYWQALEAVQALHAHLRRLREGVPFDLELSIDEHPADVPTFACLTSPAELAFVLAEAARRGIPLTHVAPNTGIEKGTDYRGDDGLAGLEARSRALCRVAEKYGVMLDFHSGDDLSPATRRAIGRATAGRAHFKISPALQLLFAEVLAGHHPGLFRRWWADAWAYAQQEAAGGSALAVACMRDAAARGLGDLPGSARDPVFHHFGFAFVGRRDAGGQFRQREEFYALSPAFYRAYQERVVRYLEELAEDLALRR